MPIKSSKIIQRIISCFTLFFFISSCSQSSGPPPTNTNPESNISCEQPQKSFSIKNASLITKPNPNFRTIILKKSSDNPIEIKTTFKYPLAETVEHQGIKIIPSIIKNVHHTAITPQEDKKRKKELLKELRKKLREKYKLERKSLIREQREERILNRESFIDLLKVYPKGSPEREEFINEQIELRQEIISEQLDDRQELKDKYKSDIEELKRYLKPNYEAKNFSIKNDPDCEFDPSCNPFDYVNYGGIYDDTTDYNFFSPEDSYQYDNTYVDGNPYDDSTQTTQPQISTNESDYDLGNTVDQVLTKKNINVSSCLFSDVSVQKKDTTLSFNVKGVSQGCNLNEFSFTVKSKEDPNSCEPDSQTEIEMKKKEGHTLLDDLGNLPKIIGQLNTFNQSKDYDVIMNVTDTSGNSDSINLGTFNAKATNPLKFEDFSVTNEYTLDKLKTSLTGNTDQTLLNYLINTYRFTISNNKPNSKFSFVIKDDSGTPDSSGYYQENDLGNTFLGSQCSIYSEQNTSPDGKTGIVFEIQREKFPTGRYHIFLLDENKVPVRNFNGNIKPIDFFITNLNASTYATNIEINQNSEESRIPTSDSGNLSQKMIFFPTIYESDKTKIDYEIRTANTNIPNSQNCFQSKFLKDTFSETSPISNYQKYVSSQLIKNNQFNVFDKFNSVTSQSCKNILVGASVDLTNPDPKLNYKLYKEGRNVLLALEIEDNNCKRIDSYNFVARVGTKHIVNHNFSILKEYGKSCKDDFVFVKVKKAILSDDLQSEQISYIKGLEVKPTTPQQDGSIINSKKNIFDYFAYVNNSLVSEGIANEGTKIRITKCDNLDIPCSPLDYTKGKEKVEQLIKNINQSKVIDDKPFSEGDSVDFYPLDYDFKTPTNVQELYNSVFSYLPFSTQADSGKSTYNIDGKVATSLNSKENDIFKIIEPKRTDLINEAKSLKFLFQTTKPDPKVISQRLTTLSKKSIQLSKEITSASIPYNGTKVTAVSSPRIGNVLIDSLLIVKDVLDVATALNNQNADAKDNYSNTIDNAVKVIRKSYSSECLRYASKSLLARVRNYIATYIVDPLQTRVLIIDQKTIWSITENDLNTLAILSIGSLPGIKIAQDKLDSECKDNFEGCTISDFNNQGNLVEVSEKVIKCRVKYKLFNNILVKRNLSEKNNLANYLELTNKLKMSIKFDSSSKTSGFTQIKNKDNNDYFGKYGISGDTKILDKDISNVEAFYKNNTTITNWLQAKKYTSFPFPRIYQNINETPEHIESHLMETIAQENCKNNIRCNLDIKIFTDRKTCIKCSEFLNKVQTITPNITIDNNLEGIYLSSELIPNKKEGFYKNL